MENLLAIGEIMLEMADVGDGLYKKSFAGDTFNVAHYMSVVSGGTFKASYLSAIGTDDVSQQCLDFLERHGVDSQYVLRDPARTIGLFILYNDDVGEKQYGYWRGQAAARVLFRDVRDLTGWDNVYLSGITAAITEYRDNLLGSLAAARKAGSRIIYDLNHRKLLWTPEQAREFAARILPLADMVKISDEELGFLYPGKDIASFSGAYPDSEWVLTCAARKAEIWQAGALRESHVFEPVDKVVDSSAAGDAFMATFLYSRFAGLDNRACLVRAHQVASQVVCGKGSIIPIDLSKVDAG